MSSFTRIVRQVDPRCTLALVLFALLDALCYPLITLGLQDAPHLTFAFLRALLAGGTLAVVAIVLRRPLPRGGATWFALAGIGVGTTSLGFAGMFHAAEFVAPGTATVISHSQPLLAALLAYWFLGERLANEQRLGLVVAFGGIVVVSLPQLVGGAKASFAMGLIYIVLATAGVSVGNVLMKALGGRVDPLVGTASQLLLGAVPLGLAASLQEQPTAIDWSPRFLVSLLGLALLGSALARALWFAILEQVPLSRANAFTFLSPFIAIAAGVAFFAESPGPSTFLGLALTAVGIALVERAAQAAPRKLMRTDLRRGN